MKFKVLLWCLMSCMMHASDNKVACARALYLLNKIVEGNCCSPVNSNKDCFKGVNCEKVRLEFLESALIARNCFSEQAQSPYYKFKDKDYREIEKRNKK